MADIALILTNDWELFGEGDGDFESLQKRRLSGLLKTAEKHSAPLTVFAEVGQQFSHLHAGKSWPHLAQIAIDWELSLQDAVARGHDVQLHYHPTWRNAVFEGGRWKLDLNTWTMTDLDEIDMIPLNINT